MKRQSLTILLAAIITIVSGCGGGGSEGSQEPDTSLSLDLNNTTLVTTTILEAFDVITINEDSANGKTQKSSVNSHISNITQTTIKPDGFIRHLTTANAPQNTDTTIDCPEGGTETTTITDNGESTFYDQCTYYGMTRNGRITLSDIIQTGNYIDREGIYYESANVVYESLSYTSADSSATLDGSASYEEGSNMGIDYFHFVETKRVQIIDNGVVTRLADYKESYQYNSKYQTRHQIDGTVYSSKISGSVNISTQQPLLGYLYQSYPYAGEITVTGKNTSLTISLIDAENLQLSLDSNGDNQTDITINKTWLELEERTPAITPGDDSFYSSGNNSALLTGKLLGQDVTANHLLRKEVALSLTTPNKDIELGRAWLMRNHEGASYTYWVIEVHNRSTNNYHCFVRLNQINFVDTQNQSLSESFNYVDGSVGAHNTLSTHTNTCLAPGESGYSFSLDWDFNYHDVTAINVHDISSRGTDYSTATQQFVPISYGVDFLEMTINVTSIDKSIVTPSSSAAIIYFADGEPLFWDYASISTNLGSITLYSDFAYMEGLADMVRVITNFDPASTSSSLDVLSNLMSIEDFPSREEYLHYFQQQRNWYESYKESLSH